MNYPEKANENVEELAHRLAAAFQNQFGGKIVGHLHIFMQEGEIETPEGPEKRSHTVVIHYVPEEIDTDLNMLHIVHDLTDWMIKREFDDRGLK